MALQENILKQILLRQSRKQLNGWMMKTVLSPVFDPPAQSLDPSIIILSPRPVLCVRDYEGVCGDLKWCALTLMTTHRYRLTAELISRLLHSCQRKWSVHLGPLFCNHLWPRWELWSWKGDLKWAPLLVIQLLQLQLWAKPYRKLKSDLKKPNRFHRTDETVPILGTSISLLAAILMHVHSKKQAGWMCWVNKIFFFQK